MSNNRNNRANEKGGHQQFRNSSFRAPPDEFDQFKSMFALHTTAESIQREQELKADISIQQRKLHERFQIMESLNQEVDVHTKEHFSDIMKDLERFPSFAYVGNKKK